MNSNKQVDSYTGKQVTLQICIASLKKRYRVITQEHNIKKMYELGFNLAYVDIYWPVL